MCVYVCVYKVSTSLPCGSAPGSLRHLPRPLAPPPKKQKQNEPERYRSIHPSIHQSNYLSIHLILLCFYVVPGSLRHLPRPLGQKVTRTLTIQSYQSIHPSIYSSEIYLSIYLFMSRFLPSPPSTPRPKRKEKKNPPIHQIYLSIYPSI